MNGPVGHTYVPFVPKQQAASSGGGSSSGGGGALGWAGLGWLDFEGWPSIRFVMAERTVYAGAGRGG